MGTRRSASEWSGLVARWRSSGTTAREFSQSQGLSPHTLRWWSWQLGARARREKETAGPGLGWVELPVARVAIAPLVVVLGEGVEVRVPVDFDAPTLVRLVRALGVEC